MPLYQEKSKRKPSGGRIKEHRKMRKHLTGRVPMMTKPGDTQVYSVRTVGGNTKHKLRSVQTINVVDQKAKTTKKATLQSVVDNEANRNFIRRNILTKGAVVQTDLGKVKITSRPGQSNIVNGVLVQ